MSNCWFTLMVDQFHNLIISGFKHKTFSKLEYYYTSKLQLKLSGLLYQKTERNCIIKHNSAILIWTGAMHLKLWTDFLGLYQECSGYFHNAKTPYQMHLQLSSRDIL